MQEGGAVSKGDIIIELTGDELTESIQSASESLRSAEISMQNQQDNMSNYTITSPISGTIIEKDAKQGDALTSGSTLCVIYDLSYLERSSMWMSCRSAHCPWARKSRSPLTL